MQSVYSFVLDRRLIRRAKLAANLVESAAYTPLPVLLSNLTGSLYNADCVARPAGNSQLEDSFWYAHPDVAADAMQAVRPDRLATAMTSFVCSTLGLTSISPPSLSIATVLRQEATAGAFRTPLLHHYPTSSSNTTHHYQAPPLLQPLLLLLLPFVSSMLLLASLDGQQGHVPWPNGSGLCKMLLYVACKDGACFKDKSPV